MLDPVNLVLNAMTPGSPAAGTNAAIDTPEARQQKLTMFRAYNCDQLARYAVRWSQHYASPVPGTIEWEQNELDLKMRRQVLAEKQCASSTSTPAKAAVAPTPKPAGTPTATVTTSSQFEIDSITPALAKVLGLQTPQGVVVVDVKKGSAAARDGLMPLDVVQEISGQMVASVDDFNDIVGGLRRGYKAQVRVWRQKTTKNLTIDWDASK